MPSNVLGSLQKEKKNCLNFILLTVSPNDRAFLESSNCHQDWPWEPCLLGDHEAAQYNPPGVGRGKEGLLGELAGGAPQGVFFFTPSSSSTDSRRWRLSASGDLISKSSREAPPVRSGSETGTAGSGFWDASSQAMGPVAPCLRRCLMKVPRATRGMHMMEAATSSPMMASA